MSIYADMTKVEAWYRAGFSLGVEYAEADRRDHYNGEHELRAEVENAWVRSERAFRLGILRGYRYGR